MLKRDTRVQIIIVENDHYILLKHHSKKDGRVFWGLPGGGVEKGETEVETALREVEEEMGLKVKLLPFRSEKSVEGNSIYSRIVTFACYPISGTAKVGYDPEEESLLS
jgi:ADP-ribose pyrophosphatase YjhB (NUDIX family)